MSRVVLLTLIALLLSASFPRVSAQDKTALCGKVVDDQSELLVGATVKAYSGKRLVAFGATDAKGAFSLRVAAGIDTVRLSAACLGFAETSRMVCLKGRGTTVDVGTIRLDVASRQLREVVVKAPDVRERGDTTVFRLSAFSGKGDVTLEEGLRKIPGIEIMPGGKINYLGRGISNFYVEGLQLAGSRYSRITRNLPAEYVTDIELIENHQAARIDSGRKSDDVALNIRLNSKVKFRPVGTLSAKGGVRGSDPLYEVAANGMMFASSFQALLTVKAGNIGQMALEEIEPAIGSAASEAEGSLIGDTPPLSRSRYVSPADRLVTADAIKGLGRDATLRANLYYGYSHTAWSYGQQSRLFDNSGRDLLLQENYDPTASVHRAGIDLNFRKDSPKTLISNRLLGQFDFERRNLSPSFLDGSSIFQQSKTRNWKISDELMLDFRTGKRRFMLIANGAYTISPLASLVVGEGSVTEISGCQNASSHRAEADLSSGFSWDLSWCSVIGLPLKIEWINEHVETDWSLRDSRNDLGSNQLELSLSPYYEFTSRDRRFNFRATANVEGLLLHADNNIPGSQADNGSPSVRITDLFLSPELRMKFEPNRKFTFTLGGGHGRKIGDPIEMLSQPVMQSFRSVVARSGLIGRITTTHLAVGARFRNTISLWFADASASLSRQNKDVISTRLIGEGGVSENGLVSMDNSSRRLSLSGSVTKQFREAGIKITLRGSGGWNSAEIVQQEQLVTYRTRMVRINPWITASPWQWVELRIDSDWQKQFSRYLQSRSDNWNWTNSIRLLFFPADGWELSGNLDFVKKGDARINYPDVALLDLGAAWKVGKFRITLNADNLLNRRSWHYTRYDGLDTYDYTFRLLGRTITAGITMTM